MPNQQDLQMLSQQWLAVNGDFVSHWQGDLGEKTRQWMHERPHLDAAHRQREPLNQAIQVLLKTSSTPSEQWAAMTVLAMYRRHGFFEPGLAPADWLNWLKVNQEKPHIYILPPESEQEITLIMPTYDRCDVLKKAVASVYAQTDPNWTLLIGDDGSKDETRSWCEHLVTRDKRVRYIRHRKNLGFQANYNALCEAATTEWVSYMADDDILMPEWLASMRRLVQQFPWVAMAGGGYYSLNYICGSLKAKQNGPHFLDDRVVDPQTELQRCAIEPPLVGGGLWVRRSVVRHLSQIASLKQKWTYQGWDWWLVIQGLSRYEVAYAPEILLAYVNRTDTAQVSFNQDWGADFVMLCQQMVKQYEGLFGEHSFPPELLRYQLEMILEPNLVQSFRRAIAHADSEHILADFVLQQQASWEGFRQLKKEILPRCKQEVDYLVTEQSISGLTAGHIPGIEKGKTRTELQAVIQSILTT